MNHVSGVNRNRFSGPVHDSAGASNTVREFVTLGLKFVKIRELYIIFKFVKISQNSFDYVGAMGTFD